jgi:hypothetical protein
VESKFLVWQVVFIQLPIISADEYDFINFEFRWQKSVSICSPGLEKACKFAFQNANLNEPLSRGWDKKITPT